MERHPELATLTMTTLVKFNNWVGRAYFVPVRIGHKMVVPAMLRALRARLLAELAAEGRRAR